MFRWPQSLALPSHHESSTSRGGRTSCSLHRHNGAGAGSFAAGTSCEGITEKAPSWDQRRDRDQVEKD